MPGSPGHNSKHLLESRRSLFSMSLGTFARTRESQTCTEGSSSRFKSFPALLHCWATGQAPVPTPGLNTQPAHPEPPRESCQHWRGAPQAFKRQNFLLLVSLLPRSPYLVPSQEPRQPGEVQRCKARRCVFVCSTAPGSGMGALYLFGEEDLLIFSWICLCRLYRKWVMIKTGNSGEY